MDNKKIAFIVCYNNELYLQECLRYLNELNVPEGYVADFVGVSDAKSMAAGYNSAMTSSDAKYKVYLHQDTFIVYEDFIGDVINIFQNNPEYGLLGILGTSQKVQDANYWMWWDQGGIYANNAQCMSKYKWDDNMEQVLPAVAVDGVLMITQYDVQWREDIFDGFDFYDVSQCMEFQRNGYKVGVVSQQEPWCIHDCGCSKLKRYDYYRTLFCDIYSAEGHRFLACEEQVEEVGREQQIEEMLPEIARCLERGRLAEARERINVAKGIFQKVTTLRIYDGICLIAEAECEKGVTCGFYEPGKSMRELVEKYHAFRFWLMRLEFHKSLVDYENIEQLICSYQNPYICMVPLIVVSNSDSKAMLNELLGVN